MSDKKTPRRDFIKLSAMTLGGVGAASLAIPFISSMNPGKDTLALASTEIDLTPLEEGQSLTVIWRGKPVFIKHRMTDEIQSAKDFWLMMLTGLLGGTAAILFIYSYRLIEASKIASFEYFGIPSSFVLGWFFFNEAPWSQLFPGVLVIIFAGMLIIWRDNEKKKSININKKFN